MELQFCRSKFSPGGTTASAFPEIQVAENYCKKT